MDKKESCRITKQAQHFKTSQLDNNFNYTYQPQDDFIGNDFVEIETNTSSDNGLMNLSTYKIDFKVIECGMKTTKNLIATKVYDPCPGYTEQEKSRIYEWKIGCFNVREGCRITKQAKHFKISEVDSISTYKYLPEDNFIGTDFVEIETETTSDNGLTGHITVYGISFTITECGVKATKTIISEKDVKYEKAIVYGDFVDGCGKYIIKVKKKEYTAYFPPENLPENFKRHNLKVFVNYTVTDKTLSCGFSGDLRIIIINRIKKR